MLFKNYILARIMDGWYHEMGCNHEWALKNEQFQKLGNKLSIIYFGTFPQTLEEVREDLSFPPIMLPKGLFMDLQRRTQ